MFSMLHFHRKFSSGITTFPLFLASPVYIMWCNAFYSIFRTMCNYRSVPGTCVPDHLLQYIYQQVYVDIPHLNLTLASVRGHLGLCLVSSEGLFYQWPNDRSCIAFPSFLSFPCLCHAVRCLLIYNWTIVITDLCTCDCACDCLVQSIYTGKLSQIYFT